MPKGLRRFHQARSQSFTYDALNRLTSAQNGGTNCSAALPDGHTEYWGNSFVYDAWGNLLRKNVTKCSAEYLQTAATAQNRLVGYTYDAAGNMLNDGFHSYSYDAESRIAQVDGGAASYVYDAGGQRVRKTTAGGSAEYIHFGGNIIAEKNGASGGWTNYIFFGGKRAARRDPNGGVHYYISDHLGSTSMVVSAAGLIENESEYYPFGGELQFSANDPGNHYKFTGKERDSESGLDYFGARYYNGSMGRFTSTDPGPWLLDDPQSYNAYTYNLNNPLRFGDDDGETAKDRVEAANRFAAQSIPYVSGGKNPSCGLDCSGLVQNVFKADPDNNIGLRLSASGQASAFEKNGEFSTDINDAQPGDAIFFSNSEGQVVHTGVVVDIRDGKVYFVHAPRPGKNVTRFYVKINSPTLGNENFTGVGRPIESANAQRQSASSGGYLDRARQYFSSLVSRFLGSSDSSSRPLQPKVTHRIKYPKPKKPKKTGSGSESSE